MRVALTGASGRAGGPIGRRLLDAGHQVVALGRRPPGLPGAGFLPFALGEAPPPLDRFDALVHAAFDHLPDRYRGGEGDDPDGFRARNLDGTVALFAAARSVPRLVFLSSRAVYGTWPPGTQLTEDLRASPDTLYGTVKVEAERALARLPGRARVSLRATGLYGPPPPGRRHKWQDLFDDFAAGRPVAPRIGTEVHVDDLAASVRLAIEGALDGGPRALNVSDITLDRRDLLSRYGRLAGLEGPLPEASDRATVNAMATERLRAFGWRPGGFAALDRHLADHLGPHVPCGHRR